LHSTKERKKKNKNKKTITQPLSKGVKSQQTKSPSSIKLSSIALFRPEKAQ
jgi:hypothetical protein